jgi:hypothetical protein
MAGSAVTLIMLLYALNILVSTPAGSWTGQLNYALSHPFSVWYGAALWVAFLVVLLWPAIQALRDYRHIAPHPGTWERRVGLIEISVKIVLAAAVSVPVVVSLLLRNYAEAAALGAAGALLLFALKAVGTGALGAAGAKLFNAVWDRVFKPKPKTGQPSG